MGKTEDTYIFKYLQLLLYCRAELRWLICPYYFSFIEACV